MITEDQVLDLGVEALDITIVGHRPQTKPWTGTELSLNKTENSVSKGCADSKKNKIYKIGLEFDRIEQDWTGLD